MLQTSADCRRRRDLMSYNDAFFIHTCTKRIFALLPHNEKLLVSLVSVTSGWTFMTSPGFRPQPSFLSKNDSWMDWFFLSFSPISILFLHNFNLFHHSLSVSLRNTINVPCIHLITPLTPSLLVPPSLLFHSPSVLPLLRHLLMQRAFRPEQTH